MTKRSHLFRNLATATLCASSVMIANVQAYTVENAAALKSGYPSSMQEWLASPNDYSWNPVNVREGKHPDRPNGVIYVFQNAQDAEDFSPEDSILNDPNYETPDYIPDTAVGYIHWDLDNGSGLFPGIMAISDDFGFKTNNCIMASGDVILVEGGDETKTCSNPQGTGKRFKIVLLQADKPLDLVFNVGQSPLTYDDDVVSINGKILIPDPEDETQLIESEEDVDPFRIYRYIMKWGNGTATNVVTEDRDGVRIKGFGVQLGHYDMDPVTPTVTGAEGATYELNTEGVLVHNLNKPGNLTDFTEVWLANEYATFSPAMYSLTTDSRTSPVGGYWDKNPAGIYPPAIQEPRKIATDDGPMTDNYVDILANQASAISEDFLPGDRNIFGYMLNYGVISGDDVGTLPWALYIDDDGDPATEGDVHAWWDGAAFRWGIDPDRDGNNEGQDIDPNAWRVLTEDELQAIASRPLDEDRVLQPPRYELGVIDDLGGLNVDTYIKLAADFDVATYPQIAVRMTFDQIASDDGPWVANPPEFEFDAPDEGTSTPGGGSSSGCSIGSGGPLDPTLPLLVLAGLAGLGLRRRMRA